MPAVCSAMGTRRDLSADMFDLIRKYQLDIMLVLIGICGITAFFVLITGTLSKRRKMALLLVEINSTIMLIAERFAYIYRGDPSPKGYWMVRISNYVVFFMVLAITHAINMYIYDLLMIEGGLKKVPLMSRLSEILIATGQLLLIISQFTGLYYTFDETNHYVRSPLFPLSFMVPVVVMFIQLYLILKYGILLRKLVKYPLILFLLVPLAAGILQYFTYGISLINMSIVGMAVILFAFVLIDMNVTISRSHRLEIEYLKDQKKSMQKLFEQTATGNSRLYALTENTGKQIMR